MWDQGLKGTQGVAPRGGDAPRAAPHGADSHRDPGVNSRRAHPAGAAFPWQRRRVRGNEINNWEGVGGLNGREEGKPWDGRGVLGGKGPAHPERPQCHIPIPGPGMLQPPPGGSKGPCSHQEPPKTFPSWGRTRFVPLSPPFLLLPWFCSCIGASSRPGAASCSSPPDAGEGLRPRRL